MTDRAEINVQYMPMRIPPTCNFKVLGLTTGELNLKAAQTLLKLTDEGEKVEYHLHIVPAATDAVTGTVHLWEAEVEAVLMPKDTEPQPGGTVILERREVDE